MTVYLFTGTPGSGKSLHMAKNIYWGLKYGRPVIANFEMDVSATGNAQRFYVVENDELTPDYLRDFAVRWYGQGHEFREGAISVYIDEAQIMFNSREWARAANRSDWVKFFTQHRKYGYDVYIVCQFHEMLDKQIRTLVEYEVSHRKVNNVGWVGMLIGAACLGHTVCVAVTKWYGQRMRLSSEWFIGTRKYYEMYNSYKVFEAGAAAGVT